MNDLDPKIIAAINGENGEAKKAGTRNCLMNRRQFLLTSGTRRGKAAMQTI